MKIIILIHTLNAPSVIVDVRKAIIDTSLFALVAAASAAAGSSSEATLPPLSPTERPSAPASAVDPSPDDDYVVLDPPSPPPEAYPSAEEFVPVEPVVLLAAPPAVPLAALPLPDGLLTSPSVVLPAAALPAVSASVGLVSPEDEPDDKPGGPPSDIVFEVVLATTAGEAFVVLM